MSLAQKTPTMSDPIDVAEVILDTVSDTYLAAWLKLVLSICLGSL